MSPSTPGGGRGQADRDTRAIELIMMLRNAGIRDTRVLAAIERVPREMFVDGAQRALAYADTALPIDCGQTISQPYIVAYMTEQLRVADTHKVLEVGTGSGYQAAVLAQLCRRVYTVERYRTLLGRAEARFAELGLANITAMVGDGMKGWGAQAPFDRIVVTAAAPERPVDLIDQLVAGGILVAPVETGGGRQHLIRYVRTEGAFTEEKLLPVRFVPLLPGVARQS